MNKSEFDTIWSDIQMNTRNRTKGSFNRALWYGTSRTVGLPEVPGAVVHAVKHAAVATGVGVGAAFALLTPVTAITAATVAVAAVAATAAVTAFPSDLTMAILDNVPSLVSRDTTRAKFVDPIKLREQLKSGGAFEAIERNTKKLKDALQAQELAVRAWKSSLPASVPLPGQEDRIVADQSVKGDAALRAIAETMYYAKKLTTFVECVRVALDKYQKEADKLYEQAERAKDGMKAAFCAPRVNARNAADFASQRALVLDRNKFNIPRRP
ncbi:MAG TPA: hypothetical protein VNZ03_08175 [Terriglobales bacterium]|jgi:hypothetical protein|nr:hypothetical protein [Terriglobales bacterium]